MYHTPVLLTELLELLALEPGDRVIDCTVGDGGHSSAMLKQLGSSGRLLGLDTSPKSLARAHQRLGDDPRVQLVHRNFSELATVSDEFGFLAADGILFDLGLASWQLDEPGLGLSFQRDEPLDMRLDPSTSESVQQLLNRATPPELERILETYGDLVRSRSIVQRIVEARRTNQMKTTVDLAKAIGSTNPKLLAPIFQALRIAVNNELQALEDGLDQALSLVAPHGRIVVISYHSGEDRLTKHRLKRAVVAGLGQLITPHPLTPSSEEQRLNPRSRSAKLRAFERKD